jgi:hypothetical protein
VEERDRPLNDESIKLANKIDRLARTARVQDLSLLLAQSDLERIGKIAVVVEQLGRGEYLIGSGPYTQGVYSIMSDEIVLGRLATPMESPLDKPVDIFCQDVPCLSPREVSRCHAMVFRLGEAQMRYFVRDLGSTCGTYVNGERLQTDSDQEPAAELKHGDVISLGPSHLNTYVFAQL